MICCRGTGPDSLPQPDHVSGMDAYPLGKRPFLAHLFWVSRTRSVLALDLQMRRDGDGEEGFRELAQSHRLSHTLSHSPSHVTNEPAAATDRPIGARGPSAGIQ
jgi:hypothetical protein